MLTISRVAGAMGGMTRLARGLAPKPVAPGPTMVGGRRLRAAEASALKQPCSLGAATRQGVVLRGC
jgi:hypothetical protein